MEPTLKVLSLCHVAPSADSAAPPPTSLPLTFFDLLFLLQPPVELLFFYSLPSTQYHYFTHTLLPRIKRSLSLTLQHFSPLAGHLAWSAQSNSPFIRYVPGDSVPLTVVESAAGFHSLSASAARASDESRPLIPQLRLSGEDGLLLPVLALQLTLFPNAGLCIAVATHAAIADGRSVVAFVNTWASVCRLGDTVPISAPAFDRSLVRDLNGLGSMFLKQVLKNKNKDWKYLMDLGRPEEKNNYMVRATFELSRADIGRIKDWVVLAQSKANNRERTTSTFVLTSAYIWVCLVKSKAYNQEEQDEVSDDEVSILFTVDCRARLDPPVPANYFGKCILGVMVNAKRSEIVGEDGIRVAVERIKEGVKGVVGDGDNGVIASIAEQCCSRLLSPNNATSRSRRTVVAIAGSSKLGFYGADFGWGKPKKVELASIERTGAIFLAESSDGEGGVEISLVRSKKEMDAFADQFGGGLNDLVSSQNRIRSAI